MIRFERKFIDVSFGACVGLNALQLQRVGQGFPEDTSIFVRYPTSRFASGWAIRSLTCDEIGVAFGLPAGIRGVLTQRTVFPLVPIQILYACLETFVRQPSDAPHFVAPVCRVVPELQDFT
eukprot:scaffold114412_cov49-Attheya_sp.AAC.1